MGVTVPGGRLLVVAPHATRTGSTRVLVDLLRHLAGTTPFDLAVEVRSGGALHDELQALGAPLRPGEQPGAIWVNSALAADRLVGVDAAVPTLVYVHEVAGALAQLSTEALTGLRSAHRVLCVSTAARRDLVAVGIDGDRIGILPPLVDAPPPCTPGSIAAVRSTLGLAPADRLVLGCGEASERKGADLFVELARHLAATPDVHLAWVGRRLRSIARILDHDVEACGLVGRVTWVDEVDDTAPFLAAAAVVVMTSREDPQSLVPVEAAFQGTPTAGFAIGGLVDLAEVGGAATVDYPDTLALADQVRALLDAPEQGQVHVAAAVERALRIQGPDAVVPALRQELDVLLAGGRAKMSPPHRRIGRP